MDGEEPNNRQSETARVQQGNQSRLAALLSHIPARVLSGRVSPRVQLGLIAFGLALVVTDWVFINHLDNVWIAAHPDDDMATLSQDVHHLFHACLLMVPIFWLIWLMSKYETVYTAYSKFLFWLSVTSPVCLAVLFVRPLREIFADPCLLRFQASPFVLVGIGISRWMARFDLAKKLTFRALAIEGVTLGIIAGVLFFSRVG
jgi:hypothetical protein